MKKRTMVSIFFVFLFVSVICGNLRAETVEETLTKEFPGADYDAIKPTDIKGMYEVIKGSEIFYYVPDPGYLIVGDIFNKEGRNVTAEKKGELYAESAKNSRWKRPSKSEAARILL